MNAATIFESAFFGVCGLSTPHLDWSTDWVNEARPPLVKVRDNALKGYDLWCHHLQTGLPLLKKDLDLNIVEHRLWHDSAVAENRALPLLDLEIKEHKMQYDTMRKVTVARIKELLVENGISINDELGRILALRFTPEGIADIPSPLKTSRHAHVTWSIIKAIQELKETQARKLNRAGMVATELADLVNKPKFSQAPRRPTNYYDREI